MNELALLHDISRESLSGFILTSAHAWAKFITTMITLMHLHDLE